MVVDSTTSAPGATYSRTPSWTRLLAQTTTPAPPRSLPPRIVNRSGEPGPAPINQTLPMSLHLSAKDDRRQVRPLAPGHLGRRDYFFARDPEPPPADPAPASPHRPAKGVRRQVRPLAPAHLGRRDYFFARDPEPRAVDRAPEPPGLLSHPEHLGHPTPALVADDGLEGRQRLP